MAKTLPPINFQSNVDKILSTIRKHARNVDCNVGDIWVEDDHPQYHFIIENDGNLGQDYMLQWIKMNPLADIIATEEFKGHYDWAADYYTKPCSAVTITFSY
jgi:hypothetical protein